MVVLITSKSNHHAHRRLQSKLDHLLHHHKADDELGFTSNLQAFRAKLCGGLQGLVADSKEEFSFKWVKQGLKLLHGLNKWFEELTEDLDCPMSNWESELADEYFNYTLILLDLFNSISASLSHLQTVTLSLSSSSKKVLGVQKKKLGKFRNWRNQESHIGEEKSFHGKQGTVFQAMVEMKAVALWVCWVILSGLGSDFNPNLGHGLPLCLGLDCRVYGELMEKGGILKEVKEVNEMINGNLNVTKELQLSKLEESVEEVNCLFSEVLSLRNRLMDCFRLNKQ